MGYSKHPAWHNRVSGRDNCGGLCSNALFTFQNGIIIIILLILRFRCVLISHIYSIFVIKITNSFLLTAVSLKMQPPGPLPLPIVGNTYLLPDSKPWIYFEQLAKKYNAPLITFWIGRNPTVWICDAWAASELLDKRAGIYSSRPRMVVFGELGTGQTNLVTMFYGERWRLHRKLTHMGVGLQHVRSYRSFQNDESKVVALDLLASPERYVSHFERYAASVVSIIGFGRRIASFLDPIVTEVIFVMQRAADLNVPGKKFPMLMETFPCKPILFQKRERERERESVCVCVCVCVCISQAL
jgi:hypothetical protein